MTSTPDEQRRILDVYERARHVPTIAQEILYKEGLRISIGPILRIWNENRLEPTTYSKLMQGLVRKAYQNHRGDIRGMEKELAEAVPGKPQDIDSISRFVRLCGLPLKALSKRQNNHYSGSTLSAAQTKPKRIKPKRGSDYLFFPPADSLR